MKVIFLDIDGVLNPTHYNNALYKMWKASNGQIKSHDEFGQLFFPQNVQALKYIIDNTEAKIMISSTWRMEGLSKLKQMWVKRSFPGMIEGHTPVGYERLVNRGEEIQYMIDNYLEGMTSYVIIDDDDDMLDTQKKKFVQTNSFVGLTMADADKAIEILNNPYK